MARACRRFVSSNRDCRSRAVRPSASGARRSRGAAGARGVCCGTRTGRHASNRNGHVTCSDRAPNHPRPPSERFSRASAPPRPPRRRQPHQTRRQSRRRRRTPPRRASFHREPVRRAPRAREATGRKSTPEPIAGAPIRPDRPPRPRRRLQLRLLLDRRRPDRRHRLLPRVGVANRGRPLRRRFSRRRSFRRRRPPNLATNRSDKRGTSARTRGAAARAK